MDAGIYLIKDGKPIWEPGEMLLIKNDPKYNEQWPRPLVPYKRIYGVDEPKRLPTLRNDGKLSKHLPEGTPFGLVGTSSLYKRESFPHGVVPKGSVTATGAPYAVFPTREHRTNWDDQGADAGLYANSDIHAIRILAMEPTIDRPSAGKFYNHADERLRILGEIPVRKFGTDGKQPLDPDGNPDTSFLAKIPADVAFTFQTLDKDGMVLNMAQTWHQLRPGEIRNDCGGCHAHSQKPTLFKDTAAARPDYPVFDLTEADAAADDQEERSVRQEVGRQGRDRPALREGRRERRVSPRHQADLRAELRRLPQRQGGQARRQPGARRRQARQGRPRRARTARSSIRRRTRSPTRYVWPFQSRNSLLTWKVFGQRTDGFPEKLVPGDGEPDQAST